jgi:hypothetical protein
MSFLRAKRMFILKLRARTKRYFRPGGRLTVRRFLGLKITIQAMKTPISLTSILSDQLLSVARPRVSDLERAMKREICYLIHKEGE